MTCCAVCERPIVSAPAGAAGTVLCQLCAQSPQLVAAYREGRARLLGGNPFDESFRDAAVHVGERFHGSVAIAHHEGRQDSSN